MHRTLTVERLNVVRDSGLFAVFYNEPDVPPCAVLREVQPNQVI